MRKREDSRYLCAVNIRSQANLTRLTRLELHFLSVHSYVTSNFTCLVAAMIILLGGLVVSHKCLRLFAFCTFSVAQCAHILSFFASPNLPMCAKTELGINAAGTLCSPTYYVLLSSQSFVYYVSLYGVRRIRCPPR
jgi:hypothetical protein